MNCNHDPLTTDFKDHLAKRLTFCPDLADLAIQHIWNYLSNDIRDLVCMADCHVALVEVNCVVHRALVFDFAKFNRLSEAQHLDKLTAILQVTHELTGLTTVASVHQGCGVMAQVEPDDKYTIWSF